MKKNSKNKGITLVALIITIIILLILSGITISQLTGNGIFDKVKEAKQLSENKQEKENNTLDEYIEKIELYSSRATNLSSSVLWTNSMAITKNATFATQNITLSSDDYDYLDIIYWMYSDASNFTYMVQKMYKGYNCTLIAGHGSSKCAIRNISVVNDTTLEIKPASYNDATNNKWCIPIKIIGYKITQ